MYVYCAYVPGLAVKCVAHSDQPARHGYGGVRSVGTFIAFGQQEGFVRLKMFVCKWYPSLEVEVVSVGGSSWVIVLSKYVRLPGAATSAGLIKPARMDFSDEGNWCLRFAFSKIHRTEAEEQAKNGGGLVPFIT